MSNHDEDYSQILNEKWPRPTGDFNAYKIAVNAAIEDFMRGNQVIDLLNSGQFKMTNYHSLLKAIFHQVFFSSTSFALAGAMSTQQSVAVRTYLMHHAEEEMNHWIWILEDLNSTGYKGTDPRAELCNWAAQAYLSYGVYLSMFNPIARLAMAQVLEGISGTFGGEYGKKAIGALKITPQQAKFFLVHGELDQGHSQDIFTLLESQTLTPQQWAEMAHVARTTSLLYKNIYNFSAS